MRTAERDKVIRWLLEGDIAIVYQTCRDLLDDERPALRRLIAKEGWGAALLAARHADGSWGKGFYQPKWTSSHYTLLDLKNLGAAPDHPLLQESVHRIAVAEKRADGGIGPGKTIAASDVCVNGMFLNYASYFGADGKELRSIVDFLIGQHMKDGGFNCQSNRAGCRHSSLHSSLSVLEGIQSYAAAGYQYRIAELRKIATACREFLLVHRFFKSHRTGRVIDAGFLKLPYPWRWKCNILRALDCFASVRTPWDARMQDAIGALQDKQRPDGCWLAEAPHPGAVHVQMERPRTPSRWNTLIALRALKCYAA